MSFGVFNRFFRHWLDWTPPPDQICAVKIPVKERLSNYFASFSFSTPIHDQIYHLLDTFAFQLIRICSTFCVFPVREKRDIFYQRTICISLLIIDQHGLFGNKPTAFKVGSHLTDNGFYYNTWCGIWLLIIFHIPCIHFIRELRKVTSHKLYLSFLFSVLE